MPVQLNIAAFDPLAWINEYTQPAHQVTPEIFAPILQFSLMWNLFERNCCKREATQASIEKSVSDAFSGGHLNGQQFQEHLDYFRSRATMGAHTIETYFTALVLTNEKAKRIVRGALDGTLTDPNNTVLGLLLIAHRIRNNLFHGNKEVAMLHSQVELFKAVNSLLATYLTVTR